MKPLPDSSRAKGKRPFSYQLRLPGAMDLPVSRLVLLVHHAQAPVQLITPSSTCLVYVPFEHPPILRFISSFIRKSLYSVLYPACCLKMKCYRRAIRCIKTGVTFVVVTFVVV